VQGFTDAEVERARRYHRPLYAALVVDAALGFGVLAAMAYSRVGDWLYDPSATARVRSATARRQGCGQRHSGENCCAQQRHSLCRLAIHRLDSIVRLFLETRQGVTAVLPRV
jgi:hypothetical protein